MNKKFYPITLRTLVLCTAFLISCQEYDSGATKAVDMAGEFYVRFYQEGVQNPIHNYSLMQIHNTAANAEAAMMLTSPYLKIRITANGKDLSYTAVNAAIELGDPTIPESADDAKKEWGDRITSLSGTLIKNGGRGLKTKTTVDSVSIEFRSELSPANVYYIRGHRRTGFLEDQP